jgi:hypothetical protein
VEDSVNRVVNRLQKEIQEAASKHQDTLNRHDIMRAETRCERDATIGQIKQFENKVREKSVTRKKWKLNCIV